MSATATFDELETWTLNARARAGSIRRALRERAESQPWLLLPLLPVFLVSIPVSLRGLRRISDTIPRIDPATFKGAEAQNLVRELHSLDRQLQDLVAELDAEPTRVSEWLLGGYREAADRFRDALEAFELSRSDAFRELLDEAVTDLRPSEDHPADWRSSLAALSNRR